MEATQYFDRLASDVPAFWILTWAADYPGANDFLGVLLGTGQSNNYGRWESPEFDQALADAGVATDAAGVQGGLRARPGDRRPRRAGDPGELRHRLGAGADRPARRRPERARRAATGRPRVGLDTVTRTGALVRRRRGSPRLVRRIAAARSGCRPRPSPRRARSRSATRRRPPSSGPGSRSRSPSRRPASRRAVRRDPDRRDPIPSAPRSTQIAQVGDISSSTFEFSLREDAQHLYPNTTFSATLARSPTPTATVTVGPTTTVTYTDTRFDWQTRSADSSACTGTAATRRSANAPSRSAEAGIAKAEELLGVKETEPVDFFVYGDLQAFYGALGPATRENVGGEALPEIRTLFALITPDQIDESWVGVVIPHELTHLVFDTAIHNPYHDPPRWLNEGLAVYLTQGFDRVGPAAAVKDAVARGEVIPLDGPQRPVPDAARQVRAGLRGERRARIDFMVRTYGRDALVKLVQSYAGGRHRRCGLHGRAGRGHRPAFDAAWLADIGRRQAGRARPAARPRRPAAVGLDASPVAVPSGLPPATGPRRHRRRRALSPAARRPRRRRVHRRGASSSVAGPVVPSRRWLGRRANRPRLQRRPRWRPPPARRPARSPTTGRWCLPRPSASRRCSPFWRWSSAVWASACC